MSTGKGIRNEENPRPNRGSAANTAGGSQADKVCHWHNLPGMLVSDVSKPRTERSNTMQITVTTNANKAEHSKAVEAAKQRIKGEGQTPRILQSFATPSRESFVTVIAPAE